MVERNSSFVFLSLPLCVGKKQMCYLRVGFPNCPEGQKSGGEKLFFSCTELQSMSQYFLSVFSNFIIRFQCGSSFHLQLTVRKYETCGISALFQCPPKPKDKDNKNCQNITETRMFYDLLLATVYYSNL